MAKSLVAGSRSIGPAASVQGGLHFEVVLETPGVLAESKGLIAAMAGPDQGAPSLEQQVYFLRQ